MDFGTVAPVACSAMPVCHPLAADGRAVHLFPWATVSRPASPCLWCALVCFRSVCGAEGAGRLVPLGDGLPLGVALSLVCFGVLLVCFRAFYGAERRGTVRKRKMQKTPENIGFFACFRGFEDGAGCGARSRNNQIHNLVFYQLS